MPANYFDVTQHILDVIEDSDTSFDSIELADGTASLPSLTNTGDENTGMYFPAADTIGFTTGGTVRLKISSSGLAVDTITELTSLANITFSKATILKHGTAAINATATATGAQVKTGYITSTSAAATTITFPTGTDLGTALSAAAGTVFDCYVDNTAGANTVTIAGNTNNVASAWQTQLDGVPGIDPLTLPSGASGIACYRFVFSSATACTFCRIA
jgi:hypothetical protein